MKNNLPKFTNNYFIAILIIICGTIIILNQITITNQGELELCWQEHTCLKIKGK